MPLLEPDDRTRRARDLARAFEAETGTAPQVVGVAPGRVNLIGEHTDYNAGLCLPLALPHVTWAAARIREDGRFTLTSAQRDDAWSGTADDLGPGAARGWAAYAAGVVWALGEAGLVVPGLDLRVDSTVPVGAGLSSSAALECAVAAAVLGVLGRALDDELRALVVAATVRAETEVARAPTGGMDQAVAVLGRPGAALLLDFAGGGAPQARPVPLALAPAGLALLVTDTRVSHELVDGGYGDRRAECDAAARQLGVATLREAHAEQVAALDDDVLRRRARHVVSENARVGRVVELLDTGDWEGVGSVLADSHTSMRDDFEISCAELDLAVETAVRAGALGARMTGGGFGGSSVALVRAGEVNDVAAAVDDAFAAAGFDPPAHLRAEPSPGAEVLAL